MGSKDPSPDNSNPGKAVSGWHIWKINPETGRPTQWVGQIGNPSDAFTWMDSHGGRQAYRLNNVPPFGGRTQNPSHEVIQVTEADWIQGDPLPRKNIPGKTDFVPRRARPEMTPAMREQHETKGKGYDRNNRGGSVGGSGRSTQRAKPRPPRDESPEAVELRKQAAQALDQHKADEAADLAEGKNN